MVHIVVEIQAHHMEDDDHMHNAELKAQQAFDWLHAGGLATSPKD